ncbi:MAG: N-acetyltransferase [Oligoflexia bacterium]|nr:MAG: N-acetyltransferase [Oligoflexia bacterium]
MTSFTKIQTDIVIKEVSAETVLSLRALVLRPGKKPADCVNPKDSDPETFHLGAYIGNELVGVATFENETHSTLKAQHSARLRGMAVHPHFRRRHVGKFLIEYGEGLLLQKNYDLLWMNARVNAFTFYESLGFEYWGDEFDIPQIGPHKVMYKYLSSR